MAQGVRGKFCASSKCREGEGRSRTLA